MIGFHHAVTRGATASCLAACLCQQRYQADRIIPVRKCLRISAGFWSLESEPAMAAEKHDARLQARLTWTSHRGRAYVASYMSGFLISGALTLLTARRWATT